MTNSGNRGASISLPMSFKRLTRPSRRTLRGSGAWLDCLSADKAVLPHPADIVDGIGVEIGQIAAAADRRAHFVAGDSVKAAVRQTAEERRVVDLPFAE